MGLTYANITIQNGEDVAMSNRQVIGQDEIRQMEIHVLADTGAMNLCINEEIQAALGLNIIGKRPSSMANRQRITYPVAGPIMIKYQDRETVVNAIVLPGFAEPLLSAIPMEDMDLCVNPVRRELMPAHSEGWVAMLKGIR